jgi:Plasmid pRiA4b ORF-3-like protein
LTGTSSLTRCRRSRVETDPSLEGDHGPGVVSGKPCDAAAEYALSPSPNPVGGQRARAADRLRIRDAPAGREFLFLFDYGDEWHFGVRLVRTGEAPNSGVRYPQVVASHGQAPPQYPAVEDDWDEQAEDEEFLAQWEQAEASNHPSQSSSTT